MRLFQNSGIYPAYRRRLASLVRPQSTFIEARSVFLNDRFGACHFLKPVLDSWPGSFFTNGDDPNLQRTWAREQGLPAKIDLEAILLAQIEQHRTEVFYNLDPMRYASAFVKRLPGCVKRSIAWRAAPSPGADFSAYSTVVCNFPSILKGYASQGWRSAYLAPAHDPVMNSYAENQFRPVDILFVGGYSRHHRRRAEILEAVASLAGEHGVVFHLDNSRLTKLAESPLGMCLPLRKHRRPRHIQMISAEPVFGLELYEAISQAKIVLNGAVDMAGEDRGNMRCFEALGCGALMVSDVGVYPKGFAGGENMLTYSSAEDVKKVLKSALMNPSESRQMAMLGCSVIANEYSKERQWEQFSNIVANV